MACLTVPELNSIVETLVNIEEIGNRKKTQEIRSDSVR